MPGTPEDMLQGAVGMHHDRCCAQCFRTAGVTEGFPEACSSGYSKKVQRLTSPVPSLRIDVYVFAVAGALHLHLKASSVQGYISRTYSIPRRCTTSCTHARTSQSAACHTECRCHYVVWYRVRRVSRLGADMHAACSGSPYVLAR